MPHNISPDSISIAAATQDDLPAVANIHVTGWQQTYVGQIPQRHLDTLDIAASLQHWQRQFAGPDPGLFLAQVDGAPAGFISCGCGRDEDRPGYGEIYAIYVLKQHWGNGIGYRLYRIARANLQRNGFLKTYLWVLDTNHNAIASYQRWGGVLQQERLKDHVIGGQPVKEVSVLFSLA